MHPLGSLFSILLYFLPFLVFLLSFYVLVFVTSHSFASTNIVTGAVSRLWIRLKTPSVRHVLAAEALCNILFLRVQSLPHFVM